MNFKVRLACRQDAVDLAPRLRESDVNEIMAASGMDPEAALLDSLVASDTDMVWAAWLDSEVEVMFGANQMDDNLNLGGIWMLGSDRIAESPKSFMRHCKHHLEVMHSRYKYLTNFVDVNHHSAHRWMLKLGFTPVQFTTEWGPIGHPFIQYISEAR